MSRPSHIRLPTAAVLAALAAIAQAPNAAAFADFTHACAEAFGDEGLDAAGNPPPEPIDPATDPNANASALAELDALTAEPKPEPDALAGWGERNHAEDLVRH